MAGVIPHYRIPDPPNLCPLLNSEEYNLISVLDMQVSVPIGRTNS